MMISTKGRYALRVMIDIAEHQHDSYIPLKEIAARQEISEKYLESILVLIRQGKAVRSIDIVDYMGYSKPSVSRAVGLLKAGQYIDVDDGGYITLTAAGREVAEKIYERHTVLTDFLRRLGVDEATAAEDACRMEHVISDATFQTLKRHLASPQ